MDLRSDAGTPIADITYSAPNLPRAIFRVDIRRGAVVRLE